MIASSDAILRTGVSQTSFISEKAARLKADGRDIISLSAGEPDFDTPTHIAAAGWRAVQQGKTKYPPVAGISQLKAAIARKFARENELAFKANEIIVSNGAKQVIANAFLSSLNPGDEVLIPTPYWVSYPQLAQFCGAKPVYVVPRHSNFKITPDELNKALTPRAKWFVLNSPCNPSGAVYSADELKALAGVLLRHPNVWVLVDDIYEHLVYDGITFSTLTQVEPSLADRTLVVNGVSKAYAMTGWRLGYGAGPSALIAQMEILQGQMTSGVCTIAQWAAVEALDGPQDFISAARQSFEDRRNRVVALLNEAVGLDCPMPQGAFYAYPNCAALMGLSTPAGKTIRTDEDFVTALLKRPPNSPDRSHP